VIPPTYYIIKCVNARQEIRKIYGFNDKNSEIKQSKSLNMSKIIDSYDKK
jgi:hypothetical protein